MNGSGFFLVCVTRRRRRRRRRFFLFVVVQLKCGCESDRVIGLVVIEDREKLGFSGGRGGGGGGGGGEELQF